MKTIKENTINEIVKNNKLAEQLTDLEKKIELLYDRFNYSNDRNYERLIYKDNEGNSIDPDEFFTNLLDWIDTNMNYLQRESISMYNN
jgi:hypothetical protein